jgi:hypothetical protein
MAPWGHLFKMSREKWKNPECKGCGVALVSAENWNPAYARNYKYICRACVNAKERKQRADNPQPRKAKTPITNCRDCDATLLKDENWLPSSYKYRSYLCKCCRNIRQNNYVPSDPETFRLLRNKYARKWGKKYPDKRRARDARRRARERGGFDPTANPAKIRLLHRMAIQLSRITGIRYHVDHIKPLHLGGKDHEDNLVVMTGSMNCSKGAQEWPELYWFTK